MSIPRTIHRDATRHEVDLPFKIDRATIEGKAPLAQVLGFWLLLAPCGILGWLLTVWGVSALTGGTDEVPSVWAVLAGLLFSAILITAFRAASERLSEAQQADRVERSTALRVRLTEFLEELGYPDAGKIASELAYHRDSIVADAPEGQEYDKALVYLAFRKVGYREQRFGWIPSYRA